MSLDTLTKEMMINRISQESTQKAVEDLTAVFVKRFALEDRQRLKDLEDKKEAKKQSKVDFGKSGKSGSSNDGGGLGWLKALKSLFGPLGLAALASLTGLDDAIKAMRLPRMIASVGRFFRRIGSIFRYISNLRLPDLPRLRMPELPKILIDGEALKMPKFRFVDTAGKAIGDFIDYKIKLPTLNFIDGAGKAITNFMDYKIRLPIISFIDEAGIRFGRYADLLVTKPLVRFMDAAGAILDNIKLKVPDIRISSPAVRFMDTAGKAITDFIDYKIRLPALNFIDGAGKAFGSVRDFKIPEISFEMPKTGALTSMLDTVKTIFGNFPDGATGVAGKGILGMIGSIGKVLSPILAPIKFIMRTVLRPFTQILLSVIDFVVGFYKGFTDEEGTFNEKVLSGLEGGFLGVIKGITDAFDLLFITIPAWLLEKMGMDNAAEFLRGFSLTELVDPIWAGIKGLVQFVGSNFILMKDIIVGEFELQLKSIINGFKNSFDRIGTFISNLGDNLYVMLSESLQFNFPGITGRVPDYLPEWMGGGKTIQIMPGFSLGMGDETTRSAARNRVAARTGESNDRIAARNTQTAELMASQNDRISSMTNAFQNQVVNAINDASTTNNNDTTVLNAPMMPSTTDASGLF